MDTAAPAPEETAADAELGLVVEYVKEWVIHRAAQLETQDLANAAFELGALQAVSELAQDLEEKSHRPSETVIVKREDPLFGGFGVLAGSAKTRKA